MDMERPTEEDMERRYSHIIRTSNNNWDPTVLDNELNEEEFKNYNSDLPTIILTTSIILALTSALISTLLMTWHLLPV